jgi:drug/metabolite transporter (DMT)-like permease
MKRVSEVERRSLRDHRFPAPGLTLMTLAALTFASTSVAVKLLATLLPATEIIFVHFVMGVVVLGPTLYLWGSGLRGNPVWLLILRGLCGTLSFFFFLRSLTLIPLSNVIVLFCAYPLFVVLFSSFLSRTRIGKEDLLLILTGVIGAAILINPTFHFFNVGYVYALFSGAVEAMGIVIVTKARQTNNPLIIHFYFCITGGMLCLPFTQEFKMPDLDGGFLLVFSSLMGLAAQVLMNQGFKFCKATEGSLILMSEVVFVALGGILIFKDPVTSNFLIGALLIVVSGVGLTLVNKNSRHAPSGEHSEGSSLHAGEG